MSDFWPYTERKERGPSEKKTNYSESDAKNQKVPP